MTLTDVPSELVQGESLPFRAGKASRQALDCQVSVSKKACSQSPVFPARLLNNRLFGSSSSEKGCSENGAEISGSSDVGLSIAGCGRSVSESGWVGFESSDVGWVPLQVATCKSAKFCDFCAGRHEVEKRERARFHVGEWLRSGGEVVHLTLTLRHSLSDSLEVLLDVLHECEVKLRGSVAWRSLGVAHYFRVLQVKRSLAFGWHPHFHSMLLVPAGVDVAALEERVAKVWGSRLGRRGRSAGDAGVSAVLVESVDQALYPFAYGPEGPEGDGRYHPNNFDDFDLGDFDFGDAGEFDAQWADEPDWDDLFGVEPRFAVRRPAGSVDVWSLPSVALSRSRSARFAESLWVEYVTAMSVCRRRVVSFSRGLDRAWRAREREVAAAEAAAGLIEGRRSRRVEVLVSSELWNKARFARPSDPVCLGFAGAAVGARDGPIAMARFWAAELGVSVNVDRELFDGVPALSVALPDDDVKELVQV